MTDEPPSVPDPPSSPSRGASEPDQSTFSTEQPTPAPAVQPPAPQPVLSARSAAELPHQVTPHPPPSLPPLQPAPTTAAAQAVQPAFPPVPGGPPAGGRRLLAAFAGAVVGALVVGAVWAVTTATGGDATSSGIPVNPDAIATPDHIGGYTRFADIEINRSGPGQANARQRQSWNLQSTKLLSTRYGRSGAAVEVYADEQLDTNFMVLAVRAPSPFPQFVPYQDPEALGLGAPPEEVQSFGAVSCQVAYQPLVLKGEEPSPDSVHVISCLRTGPGLTVEIRGVTGDLGNQPRQVAALVDQAWSALS